jgi:uncharacterized membrane-anchored protein
MHTFLKNSFHEALVKPTAFLWLLPISTLFWAQCCNADQYSFLSLTFPGREQVEWTSGPADASLGTLADIKIPKGYRFTGATGASALLTKMHNPIPQDLVGVLAPESGQWWTVLTYKDIGYVKNADQSKIDATAVLKAISDRAQRQNEERTIHGLPPITSVDWKVPPVFAAKTQTLEWAVMAKAGSAEVINHSMRLLGRQGVLDATVVEPYQAGSDLAPLKELMKNISFKPGQRYMDYQKGDKVSNVSLAGLITGGDDSPATQKTDVATASETSKSAAAWGWYMYVLVGVLAGGVALLFRGVVRRQRRKLRHARSASSVSNGIGNGSGTGNGEGFVHAQVSVTSSLPAAPGNGSEAGDVKPGDVTSKEAIAGDGSNHRRRVRRKRVFDYHRFYTDTVMKLSSGTYVKFSTPNGHPVDRAIQSQPPTYGDTNQALVQAHLDLIANQKELIEEQKRLMIQQAKLIDEKSKLISEKSQLLDRQAELFERDLL